MIFRLFHSNNPMCLFILVPLVFVLQIPIFFNGFTGPNDTDGFLSLILKNYMAGFHFLHYTISVILILFNVYLIQKIVNIYKMLGNYTYIISFAFVLLNSFFIVFIIDLSTCIAITLLLLLLYYYIFLFERSFSLKTAFNIGLILGLGTLFYKSFIVFFLLAFWGIISFRSDFIKLIFNLLIGAFVPFYFLFTYMFLNSIEISWGKMFPNFHLLYLNGQDFNATNVLYLTVFFGLLIQGFLKIRASLTSMLIFNRNIYNAISLAIILIIISFFLTNQITLSSLHLMIVPVSFMMPYVLKDYKKKWLPDLYFWVLIFLVLFNTVVFKN